MKESCDKQINKNGDDISVWKNNREMVVEMIAQAEKLIVPIDTVDKEAA